MNLKLPSPTIGEAIKADHIRQISAAIRRLMPRPSPTVRVEETANGVCYHASPGGAPSASINHAWRPSLARSEGTTDYITVYPGSFAGQVPTINGDFLFNDPAPQLAIANADSTEKFVYLRAAITLTITDGFINGYTINTLTIEAFNSQQTSNSSNFYLLLFSWKRGRHVQYTYWSQGFVARDDGTASSTPIFYNWAV